MNFLLLEKQKLDVLSCYGSERMPKSKKSDFNGGARDRHLAREGSCAVRLRQKFRATKRIGAWRALGVPESAFRGDEVRKNELKVTDASATVVPAGNSASCAARVGLPAGEWS